MWTLSHCGMPISQQNGEFGEEQVPEQPNPSGLVQVGRNGQVDVQLSKRFSMRVNGLAFRVRIGQQWWEHSAFAMPQGSEKSDRYVLTYEGKEETPLQRVVLEWQPVLQQDGAVRVSIHLTPRANTPVDVTGFSLIFPRKGLSIPGVKGEMRWLHHGHQSWSFTGSVLLSAPFLSPALENENLLVKGSTGDPVDEKKGISWWFGLLATEARGPCLLVGATKAERWHTVILPSLAASGEPEIHIRLGTSGESIRVSQPVTLEPIAVIVAENVQETLHQFAQVLLQDSPPLQEKTPISPMGWWSWNIFFDDVSASDVLAHAAYLKKNGQEKGFKLIELDDGYQQRWGMWESYRTDKFPGGLPELTKKLQEQGFAVGLWLAPFLVDTTSELAQQHPDWFVKDVQGKPLQHRNPGQSFASYILDATNPQVQSHFQGLFQRLHGLGIVWFKLDFLFTGAFQGQRHDPSKTGLEALRLGLQVIHEAVPSAHINLCGMPIWPGLGRGHSLRYGSDIAFKGLQPGFKILAHEARNVMLRSFLHPIIRNDPDQVLVRVPLLAGEARVAATLAAMTGFYSLGDDLTQLEPDRISILFHPELLNIAKLGRSAQPLDPVHETGEIIITPVLDLGQNNTPQTVVPSQYVLKVDENLAYLALFNWTGQTAKFSMALTTLLPKVQKVLDVWKGQTVHVQSASQVEVPPHDVVLWKLEGRL